MYELLKSGFREEDKKDGSNLAGALKPFLGGETIEDLFKKFDDQGYLIFKNVLTNAHVEKIRGSLGPHLRKTGRNDFEGFSSQRVYALLAKAPDVFSELITHPAALGFAERDLGRSCRLSALLAINALPGESVQDWHFDDSHITIPLPRPSYGLSAFWAIDDLTETNGATEIIPGSHKWTEAERLPFSSPEKLFDRKAHNVNADPFARADSIKAIMPAGSLMIAKGTLYHRGGANKSDRPRLIVTPQYAPGWARQLENMVLAVPPEIAKTLPARVRELIGYSIHGGFMGYVDGMHPDRTLKK